MKKYFIIFLSLILLSSCGIKTAEVFINKNDDLVYEYTMKRDLLALILAYPEYIKEIIKEDDNVYLVMKSGNKIIYDDKKNKSYIEKINNPDLQDMMEMIYPLEDIKTIMPKNYDPGRIRVYPLLYEVYGSNKKQIEKNLENVKAGYIYCRFNKKNKASYYLKNAMDEITIISKKNMKVNTSVYPTSGTYNYRYISGTKRLSPHSFGIAIDLKRDKRDYWKWVNTNQGQHRLNEYPREIVKVFEKNYFIWGGKWNHFDILHFEYRPELIIKGKYFSKPPDKVKKWFDGIVLNTKTKSYIKMIDDILK